MLNGSNLEIINERNERRDKRDPPFEAVHSELNKIKDLATDAETADLDSETLNKALLVRTVTCLEVYLRDKFSVIVESEQVNTSNLLRYKPDKRLSELQEIAEDNLWPDLIISRYNFQNLGGIKTAFSDIDVNLLGEMKNLEIQTGEDWQSIENRNEEAFSDLSEALDVRHSIAHDLSPKRSMSYSEFVDYFDAIHVFVDYLDIYIDTQLLNYYGYWGEDLVRFED